MHVNIIFNYFPTFLILVKMLRTNICINNRYLRKSSTLTNLCHDFRAFKKIIQPHFHQVAK